MRSYHLALIQHKLSSTNTLQRKKHTQKTTSKKQPNHHADIKMFNTRQFTSISTAKDNPSRAEAAAEAAYDKAISEK